MKVDVELQLLRGFDAGAIAYGFQETPYEVGERTLGKVEGPISPDVQNSVAVFCPKGKPTIVDRDGGGIHFVENLKPWWHGKIFEC